MHAGIYEELKEELEIRITYTNAENRTMVVEAFDADSAFVAVSNIWSPYRLAHITPSLSWCVAFKLRLKPSTLQFKQARKSQP